MESIFNWAPIEDQWWVTGFNPDFTKPDPYDMTMICSVCFLSNPNIYNAAKDGFLKNKYKNLIYDDTYKTIWVIW